MVDIHTRLFADDLKKLKQIAAKKRVPWQVELRLLVHRALDVEIVSGKREGEG